MVAARRQCREGLGIGSPVVEGRARGNPSLLTVRAGRHAAIPARIQACSTVAVEF
jgi:hypothetical protein